jgi:hypothetical protein
MTVDDHVRAVFKFLEDHNGALTALATIVMAIFTALLWISTRKLWLAGERQAARSKEEFEYTKAKLSESADQAQKQTLLVGLQTDILEKQKEISRQQFLATHRSRVVLREAFIASELGDPVLVRYVLANIGGNECRIVQSAMLVEVHSGGRTPLFLPSSAGKNVVGDVSLQPGEHLNGEYGSDANWPMDWTVKNPAERRIGDCYFCGQITYEDGSGVLRHTGFFRHFDPLVRRFVVLDRDRDLNYSD